MPKKQKKHTEIVHVLEFGLPSLFLTISEINQNFAVLLIRVEDVWGKDWFNIGSGEEGSEGLGQSNDV